MTPGPDVIWSPTGHVLGPGMTVTMIRQGSGWRKVVERPGKPPGSLHKGPRMLY